MNNFNILALSLLLLCLSCTSEGGCDSGTYEAIHTGLELTVLDTSEPRENIVLNSVSKDSFRIIIIINSASTRIAYFMPKLCFRLSSVQADCKENEYINKDPINLVEIIATNTESGEVIDVTDNFTTTYRGVRIKVNDWFKDESKYFDYPNTLDSDTSYFDMTSSENIPNNSIFTIKIRLESGTELIEKTQEINFDKM
ncbi:MAG: hypothetical protein ABF257_09045 [Polaribacter sp.]